MNISRNTTDFPDEGNVTAPSQGGMPNGVDQRVFYIFSLVLFTAGSVVALASNTAILLTIWKSKVLHKPKYLLIVNLCLGDLVQAILVWPAYGIESFRKVPTFSTQVCKILGMLSQATFLQTALALSVVIADRAFSIRSPMKYLHWPTKTKYLLISVYTWIHPLVISITPLFGFGQFIHEPENYGCYDDFTGYYSIFVGLTCFYPCAMVNIICFTLIFMAARSRRAIQSSQEQKDVGLALVLLAMLLVYMVVWFPFVIVRLTAAYVTLPPAALELKKWTLILICAGSYTDPLIYGFNNRVVREQVLKIIFRRS